MSDILDTEIGLIYGLINERNNQISEQNRNNKKEEVIQGTAEMLMKM